MTQRGPLNLIKCSASDRLSALNLARTTEQNGDIHDIAAGRVFKLRNAETMRFQKRRQRVISVDTKKKELVGDFTNGGHEWYPEGTLEEVRVHDFQDNELGKAVPYGVYDVANNQGWVGVGIGYETAYFATATIRRWWR